MHTSNLLAFIAVAETASFSRASEQLHITQPAVSKRVAALEEELSIRLFDRIGHHISLSEAGRALLPRARKILDEMEDSRRLIQNLSDRVGGQLSLGTSHHIGLHRLPPILRNYSILYPDVELDLHFMASEDIYQAVTQGELEIGIITLPLHPIDKLALVPTWVDPLCFVCAHHHPLAGQSALPPATLSRHKAILPACHTATREILEMSLAPLKIQLKTGLSTNYLETIRMMVSIGLGWSLLPRNMLDDQITEFEVKGIKLERRLGVVRHTSRTLSNAALKMLELIHEE